MQQLISNMNKAAAPEEQRSVGELDTLFPILWSRLHEPVTSILSTSVGEEHPRKVDTSEMTAEIMALLRQQTEILSSPEKLLEPVLRRLVRLEASVLVAPPSPAQLAPPQAAERRASSDRGQVGFVLTKETLELLGREIDSGKTIGEAISDVALKVAQSKTKPEDGEKKCCLYGSAQPADLRAEGDDQHQQYEQRQVVPAVLVEWGMGAKPGPALWGRAAPG
jgi:hypothetical protein